jgi:hypothetical protein
MNGRTLEQARQQVVALIVAMKVEVHILVHGPQLLAQATVMSATT